MAEHNSIWEALGFRKASGVGEAGWGLMGEAGAMQVPGAELAGVFNMGGAAVANYCSILERVA